MHLLKRAVQKGFVKVTNAPAAPLRILCHAAQGFREKSRLVTEYLETIPAFLQQRHASEYRRIARACARHQASRSFVPSSAVVNSLKSPCWQHSEIDCELLGIIDQDINHGTPCTGSL